MGNFLLAALILGPIIYFCSKARTYHGNKGDESYCPYCRNKGGKYFKAGYVGGKPVVRYSCRTCHRFYDI